MSRRGRSFGRRRRATQRLPDLCEDHAIPDWVDVWGRRMCVVDYTSGGFPIGIFEDEMDFDRNDDAMTGPTYGSSTAGPQRVGGHESPAPPQPNSQPRFLVAKPPPLGGVAKPTRYDGTVRLAENGSTPLGHRSAPPPATPAPGWDQTLQSAPWPIGVR